MLLRRGVFTFGYITEDSLNLSKYVPEPLSLCHLIVPTIVAQAFLFCLWCEWIGVIFLSGILQLQSQDEETKTKMERLPCPSCGKHAVLWLLPTTKIKDLPIKCKRCGSEYIIKLDPKTDT